MANAVRNGTGALRSVWRGTARVGGCREIKVRDDGLWTKVDSITAFDGLTIVVWRQPDHATGV
jgi:hypothetical protein